VSVQMQPFSAAAASEIRRARTKNETAIAIFGFLELVAYISGIEDGCLISITMFIECRILRALYRSKAPDFGPKPGLASHRLLATAIDRKKCHL
jgi:hypothetical protein